MIEDQYTLIEHPLWSLFVHLLVCRISNRTVTTLKFLWYKWIYSNKTAKFLSTNLLHEHNIEHNRSKIWALEHSIMGRK